MRRYKPRMDQYKKNECAGTSAAWTSTKAAACKQNTPLREPHTPAYKPRGSWYKSNADLEHASTNTPYAYAYAGTNKGIASHGRALWMHRPDLGH
eukprot:757269-Rhodomonas_salina.4